jgi:hypothetical protein
MKTTKIMLAVIATFLTTWCVLGLIGWYISDLSFRDCLICYPTIVIMLIMGWMPAVIIGCDLNEIIEE